MSTNIVYPVDELQLAQLIADGWTTLTLWVANTPDGAYTNAGVAPTPATLAAASTAETYEFLFEYAAGNPAQYYKVRAYDGSSYSSINDASPFHGGGGTTLAVLRQRLGKRLRDLVSGVTTSAGDTDTANANSFAIIRYPDDYFNNWYFRRTDTDEVAQVSAFVKTGGVFTLSPAITSVDVDVPFEVTKRWTPDEYRDALNDAIAIAYPVLNRTIVSTALRTAEDADGNFIYEYTVPHDIRILAKVEVESGLYSTSTDGRVHGRPWEDLPFIQYRDGLQTKIEFKRSTDADRRMRIRGTGPLSLLHDDSDYVEVTHPQTELLIYLAAHYLWKLLPADAAATDIDRAEQMSDYFMALYMKDKDTFGTPRPAQTIWQHDAIVLGNQPKTDWRYRQ